MKEGQKIPDSVIRRLPRYYRAIRELSFKRVETVSSATLGNRLSATATQVRQDLSWFGTFGTQGRGYCVALLKQKMEDILGMHMGFKAVLIGVGRMGGALLENFKFDSAGCRVCAAIDMDESKCGVEVNNVPVFHASEMKNVLNECAPDFVILTVPAKVAQKTAEKAIACGIQNFWNLTNVELENLPETVCIRNMHMMDDLLLLTEELKKHRDTYSTQNIL